MAYTIYRDVPDRRGLLVSNDRLDHIETGIADAHDEVSGIDLSGYATTSDLNSGLSGKADDDHDHAGVYATPAQVNAKADADHGHDLDDVSGLQAALNAKANANHTQGISTITGLQDILDDLTSRIEALEE